MLYVYILYRKSLIWRYNENIRICIMIRLPKKKRFFDFLRCLSVFGCHFMKKKVLRKPYLKIFSRWTAPKHIRFLKNGSGSSGGCKADKIKRQHKNKILGGIPYFFWSLKRMESFILNYFFKGKSYELISVVKISKIGQFLTSKTCCRLKNV